MPKKELFDLQFDMKELKCLMCGVA